MSHALLAPSKSHRFLECAGYLGLQKESKTPDEPPNIYAADGSCSHFIAECMLRAHLTPGGSPVPGLGTRLEFDGFEFVVDQERLDRVQIYVDAVIRRGGQLFVECKLPMENVYGVKDQFGTGDAIVLAPDGWLEVHDLKDGSRQVSAKNNRQLQSYGVGAWDYFRELFGPFKGLRTFIHQPKIDWADSAEYTPGEVFNIGQELFEGGKKAYELWKFGTPAQIRENLKTGSHCDWCPMQGACPQRGKEMFAVVQQIPAEPAALNEVQVGEWLSRWPAVESFFAALRGEAINRARLGSAIPGWKLAEGRKGPRKWTRTDDVEATLNRALAGDAYERILISPTAAEKKLKKAFPQTWESLQGYIARSDGNLTLVPEADPRPSVVLTDEFPNHDLIGDIK